MSHAGIFKCSSAELQDIPEDLKARIDSSELTPEAHRSLMADAEAMRTIQCGGSGSADQLPQTFQAVAWNVERCLFPADTAAHIATFDPHVVLLSEVDNGMSRTGQKNTTAEIAEALGMQYAFGVEFFELNLGGEKERQFCKDDFNLHGWHGNAALSKVPPKDVAMVRLDDDGHWFCSKFANPDELRIGGRMAIAMILPSVDGDICVVSTHFESNAGTARRDRQMIDLIDAIDTFAPNVPVLIGGDLNTGNNIEGADWNKERLFETAEMRGFSWDANADGMTTRPSLITTNPTFQMKLDWFCSKGLTGTEAKIIPSLDQKGRPLSDHDMIFARFAI